MSDLEQIGHYGFSGLVGVARRDITPHLGVRARCWGPARHDLPEGVHRPLTLTVLALAEARGRGPAGPRPTIDGADRAPLVLISTDLSFFRRGEDEWRIRGRILSELGLSAERVLFHLVHTHAGPSLSTDELDRPGGDQVPGYLDGVAEAAVSAGRQAIAELSPGVLEWSTGTCSLAANRDLCTGGRALVGWNPDVMPDATVLVGRVSTDGGQLAATIVNYACHPTTLAWQNHLLSPDYVGATREVVETATAGAPCLFLQGASGELAPREQYVGETSLADRHGRQLGYAVLSALEGMLPPETHLARGVTVESGAPLAMWRTAPAARAKKLRALSSNLELPLQPLPTLDELRERWSGIDPVSLEERLTRARSIRASYGEATTLSYPLWVWMLGNSFLVGHPGEAYSYLQRQLRHDWEHTSVAVANLCNGPGFFYFPTADAFDAGTYSSWQTLIDHGALEALTTEASNLIRQLSKEADNAP